MGSNGQAINNKDHQQIYQDDEILSGVRYLTAKENGLKKLMHEDFMR